MNRFRRVAMHAMHAMLASLSFLATGASIAADTVRYVAPGKAAVELASSSPVTSAPRAGYAM